MNSTADAIRIITQRSPNLQPRVAVVLGSGWGAVADQVQGAVDIAYTEGKRIHPIEVKWTQQLRPKDLSLIHI